MELLYLTITALLLPYAFTTAINRQPREISSSSKTQPVLNLIPPNIEDYHYDQKPIYKCKGTTVNDGYRYDAPRIQLIEDPNNVGYKVTGPKIIYIDCPTTTRKPNTDKILRYHFTMSVTKYPKDYTTEKYAPVTYRSTPGPKYLPDDPNTSHRLSSIIMRSSTTPRHFSSFGFTTPSPSTSFGVGSFSRHTRPSTVSTGPALASETTRFTGFSTKSPFHLTPLPSRFTTPSTPFPIRTSKPFGASSTKDFEKASRFFESTTRSPSTVHVKLSTSGSGYLPPEGDAYSSNIDSFRF